MKKTGLLGIVFLFLLTSEFSASWAFVSPAHYQRIQQENEAKKKTTQVPKTKNQTQVVQSHPADGPSTANPNKNK
jgi:hypothetical protein